MAYDIFLFDLDGTLVNSIYAIQKSVNDTLSYWNMREISVEESRLYVGDGYKKLLERSLIACGDKELTHYEEAVENTPARILYTSHHGSGGYYRQCFYERKLDFAKYDARLPWAVADETLETVAELALKRLRFPVGLSDRARESYEGFLRDEGAAAARFLIGEEDTEGIKFLLKRELLDSPAIETGIQAALDSGKTALVSLLMEERGRRFPRKQKTFEL